MTSNQRILLSPPDVGDEERTALLRAFDTGWIAPLGPEVDAFEGELADYVGAESCAVLSSGTSALSLGLIALGVKPGDEVVVQSATFAASAFAAVHIGATPVFIDSEARSWNMDPDLLQTFLADRSKAGSLPAAVIPVDLYGMLADYGRLEAICHQFGVPLLQDAAESLGSMSFDRDRGTFGAATAVSFNGNKIITTSGGGAIFGSTDLTSRVRHLATQARQPALHYEHTEIGHNGRMSNLLAGLGRAQLAGLENKISKRTNIASEYASAFPEIEWIPSVHTKRPNRWLSVGLLPSGVTPAEVCAALDRAEIEARPAWKPMHLQPVFESNTMVGGSVADQIFERGICLPSGSNMAAEDTRRVVDALRYVMP